MKVVENTKEKEVEDKIEKIEITYLHINESALIPALQKLMNAPIFPAYPTGYWVGKMAKNFLKKIEGIKADFQKFLKAHCELDENGNPKWNGPGEPNWIKGKEEEYAAKEKEFFNQVAVIETMKFKLTELSSAKLTPNDIMALEPMLIIHS